MADLGAWANLLPRAETQADQTNALAARLRLMQAQQQMGAQNQLAAMFANPGNLDPSTGMPNQSAMRQFMAGGGANVPMGLDLMKEQAAMAGQRSLLAERQMKMAGEAQKLKLDQANALYEKLGSALLPEYEENTRKYGPDRALQLYYEHGNSLLSELKASGDFGALSSDIKPLGTPQQLQANSLSIKGYYDRQKQIEDETRANEDQSLRNNEFKIENDYGRTPPVQYRVYKDGRITDIVGNTYTPTGVGGAGRSLTASKEISVLDKDGKLVGRFAARESTTGPGWVRSDNGQPVEVPAGGRIDVGANQATQDQARATAEAIYEYRQPPLTSFALRGSNGPAIMQALEEIGKERGRPYDARKYSQAKVLLDAYSRSTPNSQGGQMLAINTATQHLSQLEDLSAALRNKDYPALNGVLNYVQTQLGHPEVTNYDTAAGIVADEVLKSVIGAGAVFDRAAMQKQLTNTRSPQQIDGAVATIKGLMGGRLNSLRHQWDSVGLPDDDFVAKLSDEAKDALSPHLGIEKPAGPKSTPLPGGGAQAPIPPGTGEQQGSAQNAASFDLAIGDSIAEGVGSAAKLNEKMSRRNQDGADPSYAAVWGRSTSQVLAAIKAMDPAAVRGKTVYLSSGASNSPNALDPVADQIKTLKDAGANVILAGVGQGVKNSKEVNERLLQTAVETDVPFTGELPGTDGRVHPRDYNNVVKQVRELWGQWTEAQREPEAQPQGPLSQGTAPLAADFDRLGKPILTNPQTGERWQRKPDGTIERVR